MSARESLQARPEEVDAHLEASPLWWAAGALLRRRRFLAWVVGIAAVVSVVVALLVPRWYAAETRVLQSDGSSLSLLGLVSQATGGLSSLLGGGGGEYTRYLAILTSRSTKERIIEEFDLVEVYGYEGRQYPYLSTTRKLEKNIEFEVDLEYNYLAVRAYDRDPERAAAIANYAVGVLNEEVARLSSSSARQTREFVGRRLQTAEDALDSVRVEIQDFQERNGLLELESQAEAAMGAFAEQQAQLAVLEIEYQALRQQYGADNPQTTAAREALNAARRIATQVRQGRSDLLPVAMDELPALGREYAGLLQEQLIQATVVETLYPLYEQILFQEQGATDAVQVVDAARPPVLPARPSRKLLVIVLVGSVALLACFFVLGRAWVDANRQDWQHHLDAARA